jgi:hypothetical protein
MVPVLNVPATWIGALMLLGSALASGIVTFVVVALNQRYHERRMLNEAKASFEAFLAELQAGTERAKTVAQAQRRACELQADDDEPWLGIPNDDWDDEGSCAEFLAGDHAGLPKGYEHEPQLDDHERCLLRSLRICCAMVDELAEYLDVLDRHPHVLGADEAPKLEVLLDGLLTQEYQLIQMLR